MKKNTVAESRYDFKEEGCAIDSDIYCPGCQKMKMIEDRVAALETLIKCGEDH